MIIDVTVFDRKEMPLVDTTATIPDTYENARMLRAEKIMEGYYREIKHAASQFSVDAATYSKGALL